MTILMNRPLFPFLSILSFFFGFNLESSAAKTELVKLESKVITLEEFNDKYNESVKFFTFKKPSKTDVLEEMIKKELAVQEAKRQGIQNNAVVIDQINTVLYRALLDKELGKQVSQIQVSDSEAKAYYEKKS